MKKEKPRQLKVFSAMPTPFTNSLKLDVASLKRSIKHHIRLGVEGLFIGGTCGEGPWMPQADFRKLVKTTCQISNRRLFTAVQVTDNSSAQVLDKIKQAKTDGADMAIVSEPWKKGPLLGSEFLKEYYFAIADKSPIPVGIYCLEKGLSLKNYYHLFMHPNVKLIKDSAYDMEFRKIAVQALKKRSELLALTGFEFDITGYLKAGYSGALTGGAMLTGALVRKMTEAAQRREFDTVEKIQKKLNRILYTVYGGKKLKSWLTGYKYCFVKMGIFKTTAGYLQYPLSDSLKKKIDELVEREKEILLP